MITLRLGSIGPMVEFLQNLLQKLGFYNGSIDGFFCPNTEQSVRNFQRNFGLSQIDGIVGQNTWNALQPYIDGGLNFIVPTNISYSYSILQINLDTLKKLYPFLEIGTAGFSVIGNPIPYIRIGRGSKEVFYSASIHANEWITSPVLMKFLADYCYCYQNNLNIYNTSARELYDSTSIYIMPMVNPDGVDLVTGFLNTSSTAYLNTKNISSQFPDIPFPSRLEI